MSEPMKPEGVETWTLRGHRLMTVVGGAPFPLNISELKYAIHAAQRLHVVERERDRLAQELDDAEAEGCVVERERDRLAQELDDAEAEGCDADDTIRTITRERDAAQARIAMLEEALDRSQEIVAWACGRLDGDERANAVKLYEHIRALLSKETDR